MNHKAKILIIGDQFTKNFLEKKLKIKNLNIIHHDDNLKSAYNLKFNLNYFYTLFYFILNFKKYKNIYSLSFQNFCYIINLVLSEKPKLILTLNDYSKIFLTLSYNFKNIRSLAIQNGDRPKYTLINNSFYETYFSFGNYEKKLFKKNKVKIKKCIPVGSFYGSNEDNKKLLSLRNFYDICLISQYNSNIIYSDKITKLQLNSIDLMNKFVSKLQRKKKFKICILLRENTTNEIYFFKKYFNESKNCIFIKTTKNVNSYEYICRSKISIAFSSTMIKEAWIYKKKAFYMDFTDTNYFNENIQNILLFNKKDINYFYKFFMNIYLMNKKKYQKLTQNKIKTFMENFIKENANMKIKKEILNILYEKK